VLHEIKTVEEVITTAMKYFINFILAYPIFFGK
jgi:hypothetical protein